MAAQSAASNHVLITETFVRLYVFLAQSLDRCLNQVSREAFPEKDYQAFLADTQAKLLEILAVNPVVKGKVEEECKRVLALAESCLRTGPDQASAKERLKTERALLQMKIVALSDLLAVFRAL
jgi:hypothetical protein